MKDGPRRHLPSSSRRQGISTRCTEAPHSWQAGAARAMSSALSMSSFRRVLVDCSHSLAVLKSPRKSRPPATDFGRVLLELPGLFRRAQSWFSLSLRRLRSDRGDTQIPPMSATPRRLGIGDVERYKAVTAARERFLAGDDRVRGVRPEVATS